MNEYKYNPIKMTPFKWFVLENFPFIEEDFDSLTSYGLWCKLKEYFDKVAKSVNKMGEQVENLTEAFTNLKKYVDDYFENLNVQDEINNKLDELAENGTLQEIISEYLNTQAIFCYDNIEDLKNATNLKDGSFAKTLGYYSKNDFGTSFYKIRNITNEDVIDNMLIIPLNNENLIAELICNDTINIMQFGCFLNDKTKAQENTIKIQKALDNFSNVLIPKGTFYITSLNLPEKTTLKGLKNNGSILKYYGNPNNSIINIGNIDNYVFDTKIINIRLEQESGINEINGIEYTGHNPAYSVIKECNIVNLSGDGIRGGYSGHVNNIEIYQNFITQCKNNINFQYISGQINAIWIHHNNISWAKNCGIIFEGNNVIIESNTIQANKKHAISVGSNDWDGTRNQYTNGSVIKDNYTEQNGNNFENSVIGIYCGYITGRTYNRVIRKLEIKNNYFYESNIDYSIIECNVDENTSPSSKACMLIIENNYSNVQKFMKFNFDNALSYGSKVKNNTSSTDTTIYPYYIEQPLYNFNNPNNIHKDNYQKALYNISGTKSADNKQLTFLIFFNSNTETEINLNQALYQLYCKAVINGHKLYGNAGKYNILLEKIGSNIDGNDGSKIVEKNVESENYYPDISPITLVKDWNEITGNSTVGLQITLIPHNNIAFPYSILLEIMSTYSNNRFLEIKTITSNAKTGNTEPTNENIDYIGQVYVNKNNRKWYVADSLSSWREASNN